MGLGLSFMPLQSDNAGYDRRRDGSGSGAGSGSVTPIQTAIQLLSLRLPTRVSPSAIAPRALLQSQGSAGFGGGDPMLSLWKRLLDESGTAQPPSATPTPTRPAALPPSASSPVGALFAPAPA